MQTKLLFSFPSDQVVNFSFLGLEEVNSLLDEVSERCGVVSEVLGDNRGFTVADLLLNLDIHLLVGRVVDLGHAIDEGLVSADESLVG